MHNNYYYLFILELKLLNDVKGLHRLQYGGTLVTLQFNGHLLKTIYKLATYLFTLPL